MALGKLGLGWQFREKAKAHRHDYKPVPRERLKRCQCGATKKLAGIFA